MSAIPPSIPPTGVDEDDEKCITIGAYVPVELVARFDAMLVDESRSKALRRIVKLVVEQGSASADHTKPFTSGPAVQRVVLRLSADEAGRLAVAARERSTNPTNWLRTLMRRRLGVSARQDTDLRPSIEALRMELRKIGRNINQSVKALNMMIAEGRTEKAAGDLRRIIDIAAELDGLDDRLREIVLGDYRYWMRGSE